MDAVSSALGTRTAGPRKSISPCILHASTRQFNLNNGPDHGRRIADRVRFDNAALREDISGGLGRRRRRESLVPSREGQSKLILSSALLSILWLAH
ncbi:hypothetical protein F4821DRAFT_255876 [Hypoxylon rubiginosum]|uniref:Uncharacterized protein n=1 Tax=Hypoxylon rubiginosum TaxID=110542 RepID=A0ACC0DD66_9PEZI|nr:hypothetical protein F4821DRAFT_255876 [Hypoxylon rubiginosum]